MPRKPIALSADLLRLQNEGYDLDIRNGYLLIRDVPYVDSNRSVQRGILISELSLSGDITNKPNTHVAYWTGTHPCHNDGRKITAIENSSSPQTLYEGVQADFTFSAKADYRDYHHKMTTYIARIEGEAKVLAPKVTARTYPPIPSDDENSPFVYMDTASSRAGIVSINNKVAAQKVGIIGLGGTGSYVLDLVAKTAVFEIHIVDGDTFSQHNAFRSPGAPSLQALQSRPQKVAWLHSIYSNMHKGIVPHNVFLDETNICLLGGLDFVFLCMDRGQVKKMAIDYIADKGIPFVEVGLGVMITDEQLGGIVRVTTSTPQTREHAAPHISYADENDEGNEYATNIQISELNSLNATLAVIQWKKLCGIYQDLRKAFCTCYSIRSGEISNEELSESHQSTTPAVCGVHP